MKLLNLSVILLCLLNIISCAGLQTSDFEVMITLPASEDCYGVKVMSGAEKRYPKDECTKMRKRSIFITSENYVMLRGDVQKNCQFTECEQITGAFDGLFLSLDRALQKVPF